MKNIDWPKTAALVAVAVVLCVLGLSLRSCGQPPKPDPALGKALQGAVEAQGTSIQKDIEKAAPALEAKIMAPARAKQDRIRTHAQKLEAKAAVAPPPAVAVDDRDFYVSLCEPGGLYEGRDDCREPRRFYAKRDQR